MSDIIPNDPATQALRDRINQLELEMATHTRRAEIATACRDELAEMLAIVTRKPRAARKARAGTEPACGDPNIVDIVVPPSMFPLPCGEPSDA
jgi:hypothetical protein